VYQIQKIFLSIATQPITSPSSPHPHNSCWTKLTSVRVQQNKARLYVLLKGKSFNLLSSGSLPLNPISPFRGVLPFSRADSHPFRLYSPEVNQLIKIANLTTIKARMSEYDTEYSRTLNPKSRGGRRRPLIPLRLWRSRYGLNQGIPVTEGSTAVQKTSQYVVIKDKKALRRLKASHPRFV
jgi:hypothetical protein